ncbi:hypothetical protein KEM55_004032, partial [Ascosphaera atra]
WLLHAVPDSARICGERGGPLRAVYDLPSESGADNEGDGRDNSRGTATPAVTSSTDPKGGTGSSPRRESASTRQLFAEHQASLQVPLTAAASSAQGGEAPEGASEVQAEAVVEGLPLSPQGDLGDKLEGLRSRSHSSVSSDPGLLLQKLLPAFRPSNVEVPPSHVVSPEHKIVRLKVPPHAFNQRRSASAPPSPKAASTENIRRRVQIYHCTKKDTEVTTAQWLPAAPLYIPK